MNRHLWDIGDIPYFPGRITGISSRGLAEGVKGKLRAFSEPHLSIGTPGSGLPLRGENIRGHVFCGFLPLVLGKELDRGLEEAGHAFEWADIKQDLKALEEVVIEDKGKSLVLRTPCVGTCGKVFEDVEVAVPPAIREV